MTKFIFALPKEQKKEKNNNKEKFQALLTRWRVVWNVLTPS